MCWSRAVAGYHDGNLCRNSLVAKLKLIRRHRHRPELVDLFARSEKQRLAWADGGAHGLLANTGAVVAHVAFHHELLVFVNFGNTERTGQHAVAAGNAARLAGA